MWHTLLKSFLTQNEIHVVKFVLCERMGINAKNGNFVSAVSLQNHFNTKCMSMSQQDLL